MNKKKFVKKLKKKYNDIRVKTSYKKVKVEEAQLLSFPHSDSENLDLAFIGEIKKADLNALFTEKLFADLANPDYILVRAEEDLPMPERFINISKLDDALVKFGEFTLGISNYVFDERSRVRDVQAEFFARHDHLEKKGADYSIAMLKCPDEDKFNTYKPIKKALGVRGYELVVGHDGALKRWTGTVQDNKELRCLDSLGLLYGDTEEAVEKAAICYRISLRKTKKSAVPKDHRLHNTKAYINREGAIATVASMQGDELLGYRVAKAGSDESRDRSAIRNIHTIYRSLGAWGIKNTIGELFDGIGIKMPEKYAFLEDYYYDKICTRSWECKPGTIFFSLEPFNDPNDKEVISDEQKETSANVAYKKGAELIISYLDLDIPSVKVPQSREAHISAIRWFKESKLNVKTIGVTGSVGKTSTKDMVTCVLSQAFATKKNYRNSNVQVKISLNVQNISPETEIYVQEIGGGRPGGASRHSRMIAPDIAIVTNIGTAHIGNYGSQEELARNKLMIADGLNEDGYIILNGDDPLLWKYDGDHKAVFFAVHNHEADYYADNIVLESNEVQSFDVVYGDKRVRARINVAGEHNILNALCAFAIGKIYGMEDEKILEGLLQFQTSGVRQNWLNVGGFNILADCFNASLTSLGTSLEMLSDHSVGEGGKKVAVIGDITGMGELQDQVNDEIADHIDECTADVVICYGSNAKEIAEKAQEYSGTLLAFDEEADLDKWINNNLSTNDVIGFKGGSKVHFDQRLDNIFGTNLSDEAKIDKNEYSKVNNKGLQYRVFDGWATVFNNTMANEKIELDAKVNGEKLIKIAAGAFANRENIKEVVVGKNIRHIGDKAFSACTNLEKITLSPSVKFIGSETFAGCENLEEITFFPGIVEIGEGAFANCKKLKKIVIPEAKGKIKEEAFQGFEGEVEFI
ncbi:MAG: leucine-rich repeat protein [Clostridia bacterium]|nr:leucine-rich repeat protein [Clostridia bacterium]